MLHLLMVFLVCLAFACNPKTPSHFISYENDSFTFIQHKAITPISPNSSAAMSACIVTPDLPQGLSLSAACVISGKASLPAAAQNFTITATIGYNKVSTTLSLEVLSLIKTIAAGPDWVFALLEDGSTWTWERSIDPPTPVRIQEFSNKVKAIAGDRDVIYTLDEDGKLWAWKLDIAPLTPVQVQELSRPMMAIAASQESLYALDEEGKLWAWKLGIDPLTPVQVQELSRPMMAIAASQESLYALDEEGKLWAWGYNEYGQLGNGTTIDSPTPVQVQGLSNKVKAIAASSDSAYALDEEGKLWAWGYNEYGQLGNGTTTDSPAPVQVQELKQVKAIAAEHNSAYALDEDGKLWAWGNNFFGQLGNGTKIDSSTPVQVGFDWEKIFADAAQ